MVLPASRRISRVLRYSGIGSSLDAFAYGAITLFGWAFHPSSASVSSTSCRPTTPESKPSGLASFPFARRYLGNRSFFLFLRVLRCFSSPGYPLIGYVFTYGYLSITLSAFPHSEICGLSDICSCPQLIAACHVLLRLPVPRHPPYALSHLTSCSLFFLYTVSCFPHSSVTYLSMLLLHSVAFLV